MRELFPVLKDRAIFIGWIAGLVLIASLIWGFSFPARSAMLMRSVNRVLAQAGDNRTLSAPLLDFDAEPVPLGCWYSVNGSDSIFFVFVIMQEGILVPCGAEISEEGRVLNMVPLGGHARQAMTRIPEGLIRIYIRRIESAVASERGNA